ELNDEVAGYFTTGETVNPISVLQIDNGLQEILRRRVALRLLDSLWVLREAVASSTLGFSIIRMGNGSPPPDGFRTKFPLPTVR
ncbi:MAG: hypothetical protein O7E57_04185, partial [Gammaproteobacteria bacterium]|nr:hypothetical protein [Gammaproteobacteria bacterium]